MFKKAIVFFIICIVAGIAFSTSCKNPLKKAEPYPAANVKLNEHNIKVQRLNIPLLTTHDINKILDLHYQNNTYYLSLRNNDNKGASVRAFERHATFLSPLKSFGKDGKISLKSKMILDVTISNNNTIYYIRNGVHTFKDGGESVSLSGKTSANKFALLPGEKQAYLYGNDNFDIVDINKDGDIENLRPSFLKNRAAPFKGGLTIIDIDQNGVLYGGGRAVPNGMSIVVAFDSQGNPLKQYGTANLTAKVSIYNLIDITILRDYVCVLDGFNLKIWHKNGSYLGSINNSELLGNNLNALKLTTVKDNTMVVLGYFRTKDTNQVNIALSEVSL